MNKIDRKGFTLIELLAVITIMGILMLVAIPAVSRTIENTRRDTFASTAKSYINALKQSIAADEVEVVLPDKTQLISSAPSGCYFYSFRTDEGDTATDLMEQGGKSSWGNANVGGYVAVRKDVDSRNNTKYTYAIFMVDEANRGIGELTPENSIKRSIVATKDAPAIKEEPNGNADQDAWTITTKKVVEGETQTETKKYVLVKPDFEVTVESPSVKAICKPLQLG